MSESNVNDPGVKKLTVENWQQPDEAPALWRQMTAVAKTAEDWAKFFLAPTLRPEVPVEVAKLLEVARGSMMYSWYYYPLATLGMAQCFRVRETGVRLRCEKEGIVTTFVNKNGKKGFKSFNENIESLMQRGIISRTEAMRWEALRNLRNMVSHPEYRAIFDPGQVEGELECAVDDLNKLFA